MKTTIHFHVNNYNMNDLSESISDDRKSFKINPDFEWKFTFFVHWVLRVLSDQADHVYYKFDHFKFLRSKTSMIRLFFKKTANSAVFAENEFWHRNRLLWPHISDPIKFKPLGPRWTGEFFNLTFFSKSQKSLTFLTFLTKVMVIPVFKWSILS